MQHQSALYMHSFNIQQGATPVIMTILQRSVGKWPMASSYYALGFLQITTPIRAERGSHPIFKKCLSRLQSFSFINVKLDFTFCTQNSQKIPISHFSALTLIHQHHSESKRQLACLYLPEAHTQPSPYHQAPFMYMLTLNSFMLLYNFTPLTDMSKIELYMVKTQQQYW